MREYKFRGKRLDNDEWVEGHYGKKTHPRTGEDQHYILVNVSLMASASSYFVNYEVDPATVGQFTGFVDCKGHEIYKDSICRYWMDGVWKVGYIIWHQGGFAIHVTKMGDIKTSRTFNFQSFIPTPDRGNVMGDQFEVIGNIHDNPDLLEGGRE
jgi:uncharacterized phage protein (TIGR01671 family)